MAVFLERVYARVLYIKEEMVIFINFSFIIRVGVSKKKIYTAGEAYYVLRLDI